MHGVGDPLLKPGVLQRLPHHVECLFGQVEDFLVGFGQFPRGGYLSEVVGGHGYNPVDQVAPPVGELIIDAAHKLVPGKIGVLVFRAGNRNEIAEGVRTELLEEVLHIDHHALG